MVPYWAALCCACIRFKRPTGRVRGALVELIRVCLLYTSLLDDAGHLAEVTGQKVGFRKFELKNNRMLLNGKRIVFKGCLLYTSKPCAMQGGTPCIL